MTSVEEYIGACAIFLGGTKLALYDQLFCYALFECVHTCDFTYLFLTCILIIAR